MAYLTEEKFDMKEMTTILHGILPDVDSSFITDANSKQVEAALFVFRDFLTMRSRKRKAEEEDYRIASKATFSWRTTKAYHDNPVFEEDDDTDGMWWQKPELSKEKKLEKLRAAERDVKFDLSNKKFLLQNKAKTLSNTRPFQRQDPSYRSDRSYGSYQRPSQTPYGRPDSRRCHWCQGIGHIARNCPMKSQQYPQQQLKALPQPGHGKTRPMGNDN